MIYKINSSNIPDALSKNYKLIILSNDSLFALVQKENNNDLLFLEEYNDNTLNTLLSLPIWKQPCVNCGEG